jgi:hypothetical protein
MSNSPWIPSQKFLDKFVEGVMVNISEAGFMRTLYYYATNNKFRSKQELSAFLKRQIEDPDEDLKAIAGGFFNQYPDPDERIVAILHWAYYAVKYKGDRSNWGFIEYWADAIETLKRGEDDCDGINALIYVVARLSGISPIKLWCNIGDVESGGHFWLIYFTTKDQADRFVSIDGTYYVDLNEISKRPTFSFTLHRYRKIWYTFNDFATYKMN